MTAKYEVNSDGIFVDLTYRGTDSSYYRWYIDNKGKRGGLPKEPYHHLCRRHASRCCRNFAMKDVVHVQKWAPISRNSASDLFESCGQASSFASGAAEVGYPSGLIVVMPDLEPCRLSPPPRLKI